jgi:hypothetical protein
MNAQLTRQFEISADILVVPADQAPEQAIIITDDQPRDIRTHFATSGRLLNYHSMNAMTLNGRAVEAGLTSEQSYPLQIQTRDTGEVSPSATMTTGTRISVTPRYTLSGIRIDYRIVSIPDTTPTPTVALEGVIVAKDCQTIELTARGQDTGAIGRLFTDDAQAAVIAISVKEIAPPASVVTE